MIWGFLWRGICFGVVLEWRAGGPMLSQGRLGLCFLSLGVSPLYRATRLALEPGRPACRPVLKHGPRSLTYAQVFGWQALGRNESEIGLVLLRKPGRDVRF